MVNLSSVFLLLLATTHFGLRLMTIDLLNALAHPTFKKLVLSMSETKIVDERRYENSIH